MRGIGRPSRDFLGGTAAWSLLAVLLTLAPAPAGATLQPADDTPAGTAAAVELALSTLATLPPTSRGRTALDAASAACASITPPPAGGCTTATAPASPCTSSGPPANGCLAIDADRCRAALAALYDTLGGDASDALWRDLFRTARHRVADALSRLAWAPRPDAGGRCAVPARSGDRAARIELGADGRGLALRPLRPLRAGRRYRALLDGLPPDVTVRWWLGADAVPEVEADLLAAYEATFPRRDDRFAEDEVRRLLKRIAVEELAPSGVPGSTGIRGRLSRPLDGSEITRLRASFVPERSSPNGAAGGTLPALDPRAGVALRTLDPRAALLAYRSAFTARACDGAANAGGALERVVEPGFADPAVAAVYRGRYASAELSGTAHDAEHGTPAAPAPPVEHGFVVALPAGFDPATTPLVLLVHGHGGNAQAMLKNNAIGLARRGMASMALDLPAHGERTGEPELAVPLEPARLTHGLRQAAVDVLALIDATLRCGLAPPDGARRWVPGELRFLGYSLGASVGVLVRAVEPRIGTTVLIAPPADLVDWQVIQVPRVLGVTAYGACSGGSTHGTKCRGTCEPDGTCIADPQLVGFGDLLSFPYGAIFAAAQPVSFAGERTGPASTAPLLLITAGVDMAVGPAAGPRLADVYGMTIDATGGRRGRGTRLVQWPAHGHDLLADLQVRRQAYDFLATRGRRLVPVPSGP